MNIEGLLRFGIPPKQLARDFMDKLLRNGEDAAALRMEATVEFLNGGLAVLGVKTAITPQNVEQDQVEYPDNWLEYKFKPLDKKVLAFNDFLEHIFMIMLEQQRESDAGSEGPVQLVIELVCFWHRECERLLRTESTLVDHSKYTEAVAHINMQLLGLLHYTRLKYGHIFPMLHTICNRFLLTACEGMFYERTHCLSVDFACKLMSGDDLVWFVECRKDSLDVFRKALSVQHKAKTHKRIFNHLKLLIDQHTDKPEILRILTEFLTTNELQKIYYHNLLNKRNFAVLVPLLNLLHSLQSHLISLDCFDHAFMAAFLEALLSENCPELAVTVYVDMMHKKGVADNELVQHIMDHFLNREPDVKKLPAYVHKISQNFPYMRNCLDDYFKTIKADDQLGSVFAARFLLTVHTDMLESMTDNLTAIEQLLLRLPAILAELQFQPAILVLLEVFQQTQSTVLQESSARFHEIIENWENYALETFVEGKGMDFPLLHNLFVLLKNVVAMTGNRRAMEDACEKVVSVYFGYEGVLQVHDTAGELPESDFFNAYCTVLKKLILIIAYDVVPTDLTVNVLKTLKVRFCDKPETISLAEQTNTFIGLYSIDVLTLCVTAISLQPSLPKFQQSLVTEVVIFLQRYLSQQLKQADQLLKKPVVALKTVYNNLIHLYFIFPPHSKIAPLTLDAPTYQVLTSVLVALDLNARHVQLPPLTAEPSQVSVQRSREYKEKMFAQYIDLHCTKAIELPSNEVRKVISQYGRPPKTFDSHIEKLITALAHNHFEKYKYVMCLVIFTIGNAYPDATFAPILKAHKLLIEKIMRNAKEFKLHIVLNMLDMSRKKIAISAPTTTNRLQILKHLPLLLNNSDLGDEDHRALILTLAQKVNSQQLSVGERKCLQAFTAYIANPNMPRNSRLDQPNA